jgi:hypothetical protein
MDLNEDDRLPINELIAAPCSVIPPTTVWGPSALQTAMATADRFGLGKVIKIEQRGDRVLCKTNEGWHIIIPPIHRRQAHT